MRRIFELDGDYLDEAAFRAAVVEEFPQLRTDVDGFEDLTHLVTGALERLANEFIRAGDLQELQGIFEFVAYLARHSSQLHPNVLNALHVSFLEGLQFEHPRHGKAAKAALPPVLRQMWEAQMEHNRKIGWTE